LNFIGKIPPTPTQPVVPILTPDATQTEKWKEYQAELAKAVNCDAGHDCPGYENAICEWDILGRSGQEVYVWARCSTPGTSFYGEKTAVIRLDADGSIQNVEVPATGASWKSDTLRLFPVDILAKFGLYPLSERMTEIISHFYYRQSHPEEPPLIIFSVISAATPSGGTWQGYRIDKTAPVVLASLQNPTSPSASTVNFTVIFSEAVSGVETSDFSLTTSGVTGAGIASVSGSGSVYTVAVDTGSGSGTIRLDVLDDDTILDIATNPLGGVGVDNGSFVDGQPCTVTSLT
jgi:phosphate/sulfate permease